METAVAPLAAILELNTDLRFPISDDSPLGTLAFLTQHDSYHIGQLAFLRRQLGKAPMAYTRRTRTAPPAGAV